MVSRGIKVFTSIRTQLLASSSGNRATLFVLAKAMLGKSVVMRKQSVGPDPCMCLTPFRN